MNNVTIDGLIERVSNYESNNLELIRKAYDYADYMHSG